MTGGERLAATQRTLEAAELLLWGAFAWRASASTATGLGGGVLLDALRDDQLSTGTFPEGSAFAVEPLNPRSIVVPRESPALRGSIRHVREKLWARSARAP